VAAQHRDLVSEHDNFDGQFLSFVPAKPEQLEQANEGPVEEGQRHNSSWLTISLWRRSRWKARTAFSAPTGLQRGRGADHPDTEGSRAVLDLTSAQTNARVG
jgi:hypothetical protein